VAVAELLLRRGHEVELFISNKSIDAKIAAGHPHLKFIVLPAVGWTGLAGAPRFAWRLAAAFARSLGETRRFQPGALLGMGGFTSVPTLLAGRACGVPVFLHDSNAIPGKATRRLAPLARKILVGFEACRAAFRPEQTEHTGTPVRGLLRRVPAEEARRELKLDPVRKTLAVMGGSQGAAGLNRLMAEAVLRLHAFRDEWQVVHLAGPDGVKSARDSYAASGWTARVEAFWERMDWIYSAADLVVARSGAASLTEICHYGLPSILVPYPHAAENHQVRNAEVLSGAGAAVLVEESQGVQAFAGHLKELLSDAGRRAGMAGHARELAVPEAAERIVKEVEHVLA
jgi:UDP-N-acetylglucosamine--N-acetylmuramyl-(pentapeptide) pyrophosphoryl-undecaprenol N-acetylglucosamine transferase